MPPDQACLTLIAAVAKNDVIGRDNALPWRLSEDLKRFKALTLGHPIIMGRKTWDSLGRPLPGRSNIVISRAPGDAIAIAGGAPVPSLDAAIERAVADGGNGTGDANGANEIFIIGGAEIYRLAMPLAQRLQLTEIDADFDGDAYFPAVDRDLWQETARTQGRSTDGLPYAFVTYERRA